MFIGKIPWRRDRLPIPVFLGFSGGLAGKESACNVGDLSSVPGLGRSPGEGKDYQPVFWHGEFNGLYSPWGRKESGMTERLSLSCVHLSMSFQRISWLSVDKQKWNSHLKYRFFSVASHWSNKNPSSCLRLILLIISE